MSVGELVDFAEFGAFSLKPDGRAMPVKRFAERPDNAAEWAKCFLNRTAEPEPYFTLHARIPKRIADRMHHETKSAGVGDARRAEGELPNEISTSGEFGVLAGNILPK